jgi:SET domain-containing protein
MKYDDMNLWIDATKKGNTSRYINHSCIPNCVLEQWCINGMPHMCFFACEDIKNGTELTFDYNWELVAKDEEDFKSRANVCKCGSVKGEHFMERMVLARGERSKM